MTAVPTGSSAFREASATTQPTSLDARLAGTVVVFAAILALAGDQLLFGMNGGAGFAIWIALVAVSMVPLAWRAQLAIPRETGLWLAAAAVFAFGVAWRDSETLQFFDGCAAMGSLLMASATVKHPPSGLFAHHLRDTARAIATATIGTAIGALPLGFRDLFAPVDRTRLASRFERMARPALIALPIVVVFGLLLRSADPIFASLVRIPNVDMSDIAPHLVLFGGLAWLLAGGVRNALLPARETPNSPSVAGFRLEVADINAALGALTVLFAAFVLAQLGWFFGGERYLQARTGLTAAEYARRGFFQMVVVVALVVPLLVASRALLTPGRAAARRHTTLAMPILGLLGAIIVAAALRMRLYVHYYGLSTERFYPLVLMAWLAVVLVWLAATVLRGWGRPFVAGATISGLATLAALNVAAPDAIVARVNLSRAERAAATDAGLDLAYLATLSGEAGPAAIRATLAPPRSTGGLVAASEAAQHCAAARTLLRRWGPTSRARVRRDEGSSWRSWNAGEGLALRAVESNAADLLNVAHAWCVPTRE